MEHQIVSSGREGGNSEELLVIGDRDKVGAGRWLVKEKE